MVILSRKRVTSCYLQWNFKIIWDLSPWESGCHGIISTVESNSQQYNLSFCIRCSLQTKLYVSGKDHPQAPVPSLRSHLPPALWLSDSAAGGGPPQHIIQTLHLFCSGTRKHVHFMCGLVLFIYFVNVFVFPVWFFFLQEFNLIDRKELVPLQELIEKLTTKDR